MEPLLQVRDLRIQYTAKGAPPTHALGGVSFEVAPGESVGLLGESGCGKSTLALALLRILPAAARVTAGEIRFQGRDLLRLSDPEMRRIRGAGLALIFQDPASSLSPVMRVGTQVSDVIAAHRDWPQRRCREAAEETLRRAGLEETGRFYHAYPHQLSGGERQRVVIAQALACGPALLIADEPTCSLDTTIQAEILALLRKLQKESGLAMIFISHHPAVLVDVTDRILVMSAGRIVEHGAALSVLTVPQHPYTQALLRCLPELPRS